MALCEADTFCLWAAQGLAGRSRAWRSADGRAVVVAGAGLSSRDRLAVRGPADAMVPLAREVLAEVGPSYRPLGDRELIAALEAAIPGLVPVRSFGWMDCRRPAALPPAPAACWLPGSALPEVTALLETVRPAARGQGLGQAVCALGPGGGPGPPWGGGADGRGGEPRRPAAVPGPGDALPGRVRRRGIRLDLWKRLIVVALEGSRICGYY